MATAVIEFSDHPRLVAADICGDIQQCTSMLEQQAGYSRCHCLVNACDSSRRRSRVYRRVWHDMLASEPWFIQQADLVAGSLRAQAPLGGWFGVMCTCEAHLTAVGSATVRHCAVTRATNMQPTGKAFALACCLELVAGCGLGALVGCRLQVESFACCCSVNFMLTGMGVHADMFCSVAHLALRDLVVLTCECFVYSLKGEDLGRPLFWKGVPRLCHSVTALAHACTNTSVLFLTVV